MSILSDSVSAISVSYQ